MLDLRDQPPSAASTDLGEGSFGAIGHLFAGRDGTITGGDVSQYDEVWASSNLLGTCEQYTLLYVEHSDYLRPGYQLVSGGDASCMGTADGEQVCTTERFCPRPRGRPSSSSAIGDSADGGGFGCDPDARCGAGARRAASAQFTGPL